VPLQLHLTIWPFINIGQQILNGTERIKKQKSLKAFLTILSFFFLNSIGAQNLVGYMKNSGSFTNTAALGLTGVNIPVYINGRNFKQVGIGDVIRDVGGTPIDGQTKWWGYSENNGGTSLYRGFQINSSGVVLHIVFPNLGLIPVGYHNNSGINDCAGTGFTIPVYGPVDDPGIYDNAPRYQTNGGGLFTNGTLFTMSYANGGPAFWTATYSTTDSRMTSVACCSTLPVANAGLDGTTNITIPSFTLTGKGFDCNGTISFLWSRISGPNFPTIDFPTQLSTTVSGFVVGTYVFRLRVTDNDGNIAEDDVTMIVYPAPICGDNPSLINIDPKMCFGLSHQMTTSIRGIPGRRFGHAKVFFDGDADPFHGDFDMNHSVAGVQTDATSVFSEIYVHNMFRLGRNQMATLVKLDQVYNFDRFYYYFKHQHGGMDGLEGLHGFIGDRAKIKAAIFQFMFGNVTPDFILSCKLGDGWDSVKNLNLTGQYILLLYNPFNFGSGNVAADFSSFFFYGCQKTPFESDTDIGPFWNMTFTKTPPRITNDGLSDLNQAFPIPQTLAYWNSNLSQYKGQRVYSGLFAPPSGGILDKYTGPWTGEATTPNAIDLSPFGGGASNSPYRYVYDYVHGGYTLLQSDRSPNQRLYDQTGISEHIPVNEATSDPRFFESWDRWKYQQMMLALKFGPDNNPNGYAYVRLDNDFWPGQLGMNLWTVQEIGNEFNGGFRALNDKNYLDPWSMAVMMYQVYNGIKSVAPNMQVLIGGYSAWDQEHYWAMEMLLQIYFGHPTKVYDYWNMHTIIVTKEFVVNEGYIGNVGLKGALPGLYNERGKVIGFEDTLTFVSGFHREGFITECSYTQEPRFGPTDAVTPSEVAKSTISAPGYPQHEYSTEINQAIANDQMDEHYASCPDLKRKIQYEIRDNTAVGSIYRNNADASNGIQYIDGTPKASQYHDESKKQRLGLWKSNRLLANDPRGTWIHERIKEATTDSLDWCVMWQDTIDAVAPVTLSFGALVTSVQHVVFNFNTYTPTVETLATPDGILVWTPHQHADHFFFKSIPIVIIPPTPIFMQKRTIVIGGSP
jgi:hypothetical protein